MLDPGLEVSLYNELLCFPFRKLCYSWWFPNPLMLPMPWVMKVHMLLLKAWSPRSFCWLCLSPSLQLSRSSVLSQKLLQRIVHSHLGLLSVFVFLELNGGHVTWTFVFMKGSLWCLSSSLAIGTPFVMVEISTWKPRENICPILSTFITEYAWCWIFHWVIIFLITLSFDISVLSLVTSSCTRILLLSWGWNLIRCGNHHHWHQSSVFTIGCSPEEVPKGNHQWSLSRSHLPVRPDGSAPLDPLHALNLPLESSRGQLVVFLTQQLASTMVMTWVTARWLKIGKCPNPYLQLCRDDENYDCDYLKVTTM